MKLAVDPISDSNFINQRSNCLWLNCHKTFSTEVETYNHFIKCHCKKGVQKCLWCSREKLCNLTLRHKGDIKSHAVVHFNDIRPIKCPFCSERMKNRQSLHRHKSVCKNTGGIRSDDMVETCKNDVVCSVMENKTDMDAVRTTPPRYNSVQEHDIKLIQELYSILASSDQNFNDNFKENDTENSWIQELDSLTSSTTFKNDENSHLEKNIYIPSTASLQKGILNSTFFINKRKNVPNRSLRNLDYTNFLQFCNNPALETNNLIIPKTANNRIMPNPALIALKEEINFLEELDIRHSNCNNYDQTQGCSFNKPEYRNKDYMINEFNTSIVSNTEYSDVLPFIDQFMLMEP